MIPNPFIEVFRDPVNTLATLGYICLLLTLLIWTAGIWWSNATTVYAQYKSGWHRWDYRPPLSWVARVSAVPLIAGIDAWVISAIIWALA